MTSNQISYFRAIEDKRHNEQMERETQRSNRQNEFLTKRNQDITAKHYSVTESIDAAKQRTEAARVEELGRSNRVNESLTARKVASEATLNYATAGVRSAEVGLRAAETEMRQAQTKESEAQKSYIKAQEKLATEKFYTEGWNQDLISSNIAKNEAEIKVKEKENQWYEVNTLFQSLGSLARGTGALLK